MHVNELVLIWPQQQLIDVVYNPVAQIARSLEHARINAAAEAEAMLQQLGEVELELQKVFCHLKSF